jgi:hypothetical protein
LKNGQQCSWVGKMAETRLGQLRIPMKAATYSNLIAATIPT